VKALILGGNGLLGHKLFQVLSREIETVATIRGETPCPEILPFVDIKNAALVEFVLESVRPNVVINAVGVVKQKTASLTELHQINTDFPKRTAIACHNLGIRFIHISTDCVFSGLRGSYAEYDRPDPVDVYGYTKLSGEVNLPNVLTLRTSFIGWQVNGWESLLSWLAMQRGKSVNGYTRAIFSGFSTSVLARVMLKLVRDFESLSGLYHVAAEPISKFELLTRVRDALKWDIEIKPDAGLVYNRSLNGSRFNGVTGFNPPSWDEMIGGLAREWPNYKEFYE